MRKLSSKYTPNSFHMEVKKECVCFVLLCLYLCLLNVSDFFFFSCRCQHLRTLPVQRIWLSEYWLHKVWGLLDWRIPTILDIHSQVLKSSYSSVVFVPKFVCFFVCPFVSIRTSWQLCPSYWGDQSPRSYSGPSTFMISTEMVISTKRCVC